jgi:hypothetical protein
MIELNDELLSALLDGQLDEPTRLAVEQALTNDRGARVRLERMRHADALLRAAIPAQPARADDPVAARIEQNDAPRARRWLSKQALAASLVAGMCGIVLGRLTEQAPDYWIDAGGVVQGSLLQTLDQQASGGEGLLRVILSTRLRDGRYCRQFALSQASGSGEGVACRNQADARWQLLAWDAAMPSGAGFRPAGGSDVLDRVLDRLGAGEALDARSEQLLIEQRWAAASK